MTLRVYPDRQRCRACRKFFSGYVVAGQYCTYECAGLPRPSLEPEDWPREHYAGGRLAREKTYFRSRAEAEAAISKGNRARGMSAYVCSYCQHWHVGTLRMR